MQKQTNITKSRYTLFRQCAKALWLKQYMPEVAKEDASKDARMATGTEIGELARGLFGDYSDMTIKRADGRLDITAMVSQTQSCLNDGTEVICEAAFLYDGNYCAVDILKKERNGWSINEVKSSTDADKEVYAQDVAFQKWVLTQCGINVVGTNLVCIDNTYVLGDELDIHGLFSIEDISEAVAQEYPKVSSYIKEAKNTLSSDTEPSDDLDICCHKPYDCAFWEYCSRNLPKPSVFNLYRMPFKNKIQHYHDGNVSFEQLRSHQLSDKQKLQVECTLADSTYINKEEIRKFISTLHYPLYFLDFETEQPAIPKYKGTHPYQQIPFQYSLHIIDYPGGPLIHKEFLGESGQDPRRAIAEQLCEDIPMDVCSLAFNMTFERSRLKELAETFPDLSAHLLNIRDNMLDLLTPFQAGYYYVPAMNGSFSIKKVLPALFPNDPELDYHNLDGDVHNGGEAMNIYPQIQFMTPEEQQRARHSLLKYCELDTYAMVKIWQLLSQV